MEIGDRWGVGKWPAKTYELVARTEDGRPIISEIGRNGQIVRPEIWPGSRLPVDNQ